MIVPHHQPGGTRATWNHFVEGFHEQGHAEGGEIKNISDNSAFWVFLSDFSLWCWRMAPSSLIMANLPVWGALILHDLLYWEASSSSFLGCSQLEKYGVEKLRSHPTGWSRTTAGIKLWTCTFLRGRTLSRRVQDNLGTQTKAERSLAFLLHNFAKNSSISLGSTPESVIGRCQWISSPQKRHRSLCKQLGTFYETRALPIQSRAKVKSWHPGRNRIWLRWVLGFTGGDLRRPGWLLVLSRLGRSSPLTMSRKQLVNSPSPPFQGVWTQSWLSLATSIVWIVLPKVSPIFFCNRILNYTFCSP